MRKSLPIILALMPIFTLLACGNPNLNNRPQAAPNPAPIDPPLTGTDPANCEGSACANLPTDPAILPSGDSNLAAVPPTSTAVPQLAAPVTPVSTAAPVAPLSFSQLKGKWRVDAIGKKAAPLQKWDAKYPRIAAILEINENGTASYKGTLSPTNPRPTTCILNFRYQFTAVSATEFKSSQGVSAESRTASVCADINRDLTFLFLDSAISFVITGSELKLAKKNGQDDKAVIILQKIP